MMIGLVLCGGQSSRMGADKGLLNLENRSWVEWALKKCKAVHLETFISIRMEQMNSYKHFFSIEHFIQDNESLGYHGPLLGIMSAHKAFPTKDLLVLACDMIEMKEATLIALLQMQVSNPSYQAYCFMNQGNLEPLAAIYTASGLSKIQDLFLLKDLAKHSMKYVLSVLKTCCIPINPTQQSSFHNFNTPTDLFNL